MNTNNLRLSSTSTGQLERMIDDAAWLTYPLHLVVGVIKTFIYTFLAILCFIFAVCLWMFTAKDQRAEQIKDFAKDQSIYRVDTATNVVSLYKAGAQRMGNDAISTAFSGASDNGEFIKNPKWFDQNWLGEKSDVFGWAYIRASHNVVALRAELEEAGVKTPAINAPVVYISFLEMNVEAARAIQGNWYTGICLASAKCTKRDFLPRNTSIFHDAVAPQVTANQDAAIKALYATGTPEFWIATAHANGITDMDAVFAQAATLNKAKLDREFSYRETPSEEFAHEVEIGVVCYFAFIGFCRRLDRPPHVQIQPFTLSTDENTAFPTGGPKGVLSSARQVVDSSRLKIPPSASQETIPSEHPLSPTPSLFSNYNFSDRAVACEACLWRFMKNFGMNETSQEQRVLRTRRSALQAA